MICVGFLVGFHRRTWGNARIWLMQDGQERNKWLCTSGGTRKYQRWYTEVPAAVHGSTSSGTRKYQRWYTEIPALVFACTLFCLAHLNTVVLPGKTLGQSMDILASFLEIQQKSHAKTGALTGILRNVTSCLSFGKEQNA